MDAPSPFPGDAPPGAGLHRRGRFAASHSIGRRSRDLKTRHLIGRIWRVLLGVVVVIAAAAGLGLMAGGIGFIDLFFTAMACVLTAALLLRYPRLRVPATNDLARGSLPEIVAHAELWLETRRSALPPEAAHQVDAIGVQLDSLGLQLDHAHPGPEAEAEIRRLVGEHLPEIVSSYTAARRPPSDETVIIDTLARIGAEIDTISRQLATGSLDDLALKARALDFGPGGPS